MPYKLFTQTKNIGRSQISAIFNEPLNCFNLDASNVILKDKNNGTIYTVGIGCSDNKIVIVPLTEENFTDQVMEVSLLKMEDIHGNIRLDTVKWNFDIANADFKIDANSDSDGDVDQEDFGYFQACLSGPSTPYGVGCEDVDLDSDGNVDQNDLVIFQGCMSGANVPANPDCAG